MATYNPQTSGYQPGSLGSGTYALDDMISGLSSYMPKAAPVASWTPQVPTATPVIFPTAGNGPVSMTPMESLNAWFKDSGMLGTTAADGTKTQGWGGMALGAAQGIGNAFLGMQQYGLAKDAFNESKRQFGLNFEAQRKTTNTALEDRQRARVASNAGAYQSVGDYMARNGV